MSSTDVREWLREQGEDVRGRGKIPDDLQAKYDAAHPPAPPRAEILESDYPDLDAGVTEADFPPDDDPPPAAPAPPRTGGQRRERAPRTVRPAKPKRFTERIFGSRDRKPRARQARVPLGDFAEETWEDLAMIAQPVPPLARMLGIQAPYAGVVFDRQVKGTFVDTLLQPVARNAGIVRGLTGLAGPPVYVGLICATGQRVQLADPETGQPAFHPDGTPVMDYDGRTKMLFMGLRYSLLQMVKITDQNADQIAERVEQSAARNEAVDAIIASIFSMPGAGPERPPAAAFTPTGDAAGGFQYPGEPSMDGAGVDPGRA